MLWRHRRCLVLEVSPPHPMRAYLAIFLVAPGALAAQEYTLAPYAAQNRSLPGTPALFGASLARYRSVIGLRVGGAAGPTLTPLALGTDGRATAWTADADVVLDAGRFPVIGALLAGFVPTVFARARRGSRRRAATCGRR